MIRTRATLWLFNILNIEMALCLAILSAKEYNLRISKLFDYRWNVVTFSNIDPAAVKKTFNDITS